MAGEFIAELGGATQQILVSPFEFTRLAQLAIEDHRGNVRDHHEMVGVSACVIARTIVVRDYADPFVVSWLVAMTPTCCDNCDNRPRVLDDEFTDFYQARTVQAQHYAFAVLGSSGKSRIHP
jgi:hypothetical protein